MLPPSSLLYRVTQRDIRTPIPPEEAHASSHRTVSHYKLYNNNSSSTDTLAVMHVFDPPKTKEDKYNGKPHIEVKEITVEPHARRKGIAKELFRIAVKQSQEKGYKGRVNLVADSQFGSPAARIHTGNGFRLSDNALAIKLKLLVKDLLEKSKTQTKLMQEKREIMKIEGPMYLPSRNRKKYLNRPSLSEVVKLEENSSSVEA